MRTWTFNNYTEFQTQVFGLIGSHIIANQCVPNWEITLMELERQRTGKQNNSLNLYCRLLAKTLNDAGLDMKKVLKPDADIPWTQETAKEFLWRPIQVAQLNIKSTRDLNTKQVSEVYDTLNRHLGNKLGVSVEFPHRATNESFSSRHMV